MPVVWCKRKGAGRVVWRVLRQGVGGFLSRCVVRWEWWSSVTVVPPPALASCSKKAVKTFCWSFVNKAPMWREELRGSGSTDAGSLYVSTLTLSFVGALSGSSPLPLRPTHPSTPPSPTLPGLPPAQTVMLMPGDLAMLLTP